MAHQTLYIKVFGYTHNNLIKTQSKNINLYLANLLNNNFQLQNHENNITKRSKHIPTYT